MGYYRQQQIRVLESQATTAMTADGQAHCRSPALCDTPSAFLLTQKPWGKQAYLAKLSRPNSGLERSETHESAS